MKLFFPKNPAFELAPGISALYNFWEMTLFEQLLEAVRQTRFHVEWLDNPFYADEQPAEKPKSRQAVQLDSGEPPPKDGPAEAASLPAKRGGKPESPRRNIKPGLISVILRILYSSKKDRPFFRDSSAGVQYKQADPL